MREGASEDSSTEWNRTFEYFFLHLTRYAKADDLCSILLDP